MGNNPIRFNDPSGHKACEGETDSLHECKYFATKGSYGVSFDGDFTKKQKENIMKAVQDVALSLWVYSNYDTPWEAFQAVYGSMEFGRCGQGKYGSYVCDAYGWTLGRHTILFGDFYRSDERNMKLTVHELGHAFDSYVCQTTIGCNPNTMGDGSARHDLEGKLIGCIPTVADGSDCLGRFDYTNDVDPTNPFWGFAGGKNEWQFAVINIGSGSEVFADMFVGWVYGTWGTGISGANRRYYMDTRMTGYLD